MLPARRTVILSADPTESDHDATWWIDKAQAIPYTAAADTYPVGALIPNIILEPFQGDRAHIRAQASWRMGRWRLETRRVLETKIKNAVAFSRDRTSCLTCAHYTRTPTPHDGHTST